MVCNLLGFSDLGCKWIRCLHKHDICVKCYSGWNWNNSLQKINNSVSFEMLNINWIDRVKYMAKPLMIWYISDCFKSRCYDRNIHLISLSLKSKNNDVEYEFILSSSVNGPRNFKSLSHDNKIFITA